MFLYHHIYQILLHHLVYLIRFVNLDFKHYWSVNEFFIQGSNIKLMESTIR